VEPVVRLDGAPAAAIVAESSDWRADLLVVGTRARHGLDRLLLGSTAEACIRDAPCNVLVIPPAAVPVRTPRAAVPAHAAAAVVTA
jgi:nucleotide-binding universal stress UspA family protein